MRVGMVVAKGVAAPESFLELPLRSTGNTSSHGE